MLGKGRVPFQLPYLLLTTTYYLLLTTYYSLLTTYHLPLTTYHLPLTTHHFLLATYYCPLSSSTDHWLLTTYYTLRLVGLVSIRKKKFAKMEKEAERAEKVSSPTRDLGCY